FWIGFGSGFRVQRMNIAFGDTFEMGNKIQACCTKTHMYHVQCAISIRKWEIIENVKMNAAGGRTD
ncbi:unnamed protein product, partial [Brassica rapa subsp. trilocularis]